MNKFKKILTGAVALAMCSTCLIATPLQVSAASTYAQGDVNGDGSVNSADTLALTSFLLGQKSANNQTAERLDVDENGIIDENDKTVVRNIIAHLQTGSTKTYTNVNELPSQEDRTYYVYNASSGALVDDYVLYKSDVPNISATSTRTIIDDDDRVHEPGLSGVLQTSTGGTAFVIDAHTILTNAHCIFNSEIGDQAIGGVSFTAYDSDDNPISIGITPLKYHIPQEFAENEEDKSNYDYAIVTVQEDLSAYVNFKLGVAKNDIYSKNPNVDIYVTGFGWGGTNVNPDLIGVKSTGKGNLIGSNTMTTYNIRYTTDIIGGDSGSPVYVLNSDSSIRTVIGINTSQTNSYNFGKRITTDILQFVYNNPNL
ncbi:MAG: trypsin-like serine protease [Oscillospiraceae bacterium]